LATLVIGTAAGLSQITAADTSAIKYVRDAFEAYKLIKSAMRKSKAKFHTGITTARYVSRPDVEDQVSQFLKRPFNGAGIYGILAGPKGIGKSTLADHVCKNLDSIVVVGVNDTDTEITILRNLVEACGFIFDQVKERQMLDMLEAEKNAQPTNLVKIVIEVERGKDKDSSNILRTVSSLAKKLAVYSNVLVIVSEANATLEFTNDPQRQQVIWLPDLTREQARALLHKMDDVYDGSYDDDAFMNAIDTKIGFQPLALTALHTVRLQAGIRFDLDSYLNEQVALPRQSC
jgi:hypothetical protein